MSFISIVIATHNGSEYISEQLHSILDQTYRDFEIIVIDDCSNDSTVEIIKEIFASRKFLNYNIEVNSSNIGVTKSFEKGIGKSKGEYIALSDQDDIWFNNKTEVSLNAMKKYDADIVHSSSLILSGANKTSSVYPNKRDFKKLFALLMHNNARGATLLLRKDFANRLIPFSNHDLYDKWIYFLGFLYGKIVDIGKPLHYYRIHEQNYIGNHFKYRSKQDLLNKLNSSALFYKQIAEYVQCHKDVNSCFSHSDIIKEIDHIIYFHNDTCDCINSHNALRCFFKYVQNISSREFSITEKMIYFYYYMCKTK